MSEEKPCESSCEKCGGADIRRKFYAAGDRFRVEDYGKSRNRYAYAESYTAVVSRDHIDHICRCCGFQWQTLPMRKPRKARATAGSAP